MKNTPSQSQCSVVKPADKAEAGRKRAKQTLVDKTFTVSRKNIGNKGSKTSLIIKTKQEHPDLSNAEIARIADCDRTNVVKTLQRYGIDVKATEDFKTHRADILAGLQDRILKSLTDEALKKTPAIQLITAAGILFDKERIERNQSTGNYNIVVGALQDLQRLRSASDG